MSKRVTTTGYIAAWAVAAVVAIVGLRTAALSVAGISSLSTASPAPAAAWALIGIASLVMLVMWIGALIGLGRQRAWGWFAAVLLFQLIGLGILGMLAYAVAGRERVVESVTRPSFT